MYRRLLATGGIAAALLLGGTGVASAAPAAVTADGNTCVSTTSPQGAAGCFYPYGDHVYALDTAPDGHHVEVYWSVGRLSGVCKNFAPYDQAGNKPSLKDCNYNFAEHSVICMRAAVVEGDRLIGSYSSRRCYDTTSGHEV